MLKKGTAVSLTRYECTLLIYENTGHKRPRPTRRDDIVLFCTIQYLDSFYVGHHAEAVRPERDAGGQEAEDRRQADALAQGDDERVRHEDHQDVPLGALRGRSPGEAGMGGRGRRRRKSSTHAAFRVVALRYVMLRYVTLGCCRVVELRRGAVVVLFEGSECKCVILYACGGEGPQRRQGPDQGSILSANVVLSS